MGATRFRRGYVILELHAEVPTWPRKKVGQILIADDYSYAMAA